MNAMLLFSVSKHITNLTQTMIMRCHWLKLFHFQVYGGSRYVSGNFKCWIIGKLCSDCLVWLGHLNYEYMLTLQDTHIKKMFISYAHASPLYLGTTHTGINSELDRDIVGISLSYFDRYLSRHTSIDETLYQLVALTSLYLAVKLHSTRKISIQVCRN